MTETAFLGKVACCLPVLHYTYLCCTSFAAGLARGVPLMRQQTTLVDDAPFLFPFIQLFPFKELVSCVQLFAETLEGHGDILLFHL